MSTQENLMQCVVKSVGKLGFENASIKTIAQQAGLSASTVYCHYASKEEMFEATFMYFAGVFCEFYASDVSHLKGKDNDESFRNLWNHYVDFYMKNEDAALFYVRYRHSAYYNTDIRLRVEAFEAGYFKATEKIADIIGIGNENGGAAVVLRFFAEAVLIYVEQLLTSKARPEHGEVAMRAVYAAMMAIKTSFAEIKV